MQPTDVLRKTLARHLDSRSKENIRTAILKAKLFVSQRGPLLSFMASRIWPSKFQDWHRRRTFQDIYRRKLWGSAQDMLFSSGVGSISEAADVYVDRMKKIILDLEKELGRPIKVADLGTGDFAIGRRLLEIDGLEYVGCDIVPELIEHHIATNRDPRASFQVKDIVRDELPDADICLVRQVLQHLTNADVLTVLRKLGKYPYVYVTEGHPAVLDGPYNPDKPVGSGVRFDFQAGIGRGLEFDREPFNLRTEEVFRVRSVPTEWVVTFRVHGSDPTRPDAASSVLQ